MNNNRLKNRELAEIRSRAKEIKRLSKLDACSFKDQESVDIDKLKIWLQWFDCHADVILKIIGTEE